MQISTSNKGHDIPIKDDLPVEGSDNLHKNFIAVHFLL